jgi:hypothetical protein
MIEQLRKDIDAFAKAGQKWADQGHKLAVRTLEHLTSSHGDVAMVNRLYLAMPQGSKSSALAEWFLAFGALAANTDKETKGEKPFVFVKDKKTNIELAKAKPWYQFRPEPSPDMLYDVTSALAAIIKKAKKVQDNGGTVKGLELLAEVELLAGGEKKSPSTEPKSGAAML